MSRWRDDWRLWALAAAVLALTVTLLEPVQEARRPVYRYLWVVDITRSMNVADYADQANAGQPVSRLEFVKRSLIAALERLPCGSEVGLGLFTDRRSALLFEPIEVCTGYGPIRAAIGAIDWRMAWAADSRIAEGLYSAAALAEAVPGVRLVFFTDGHEAPPPNPRYLPDLARWRGKVSGLVVGVGGTTPMPIPKFDERGVQQGHYGAEEVPHRSTFGIPVAPEAVEGSFHERNAPFGGAWVLGEEHLSSLREPHLVGLSQASGLDYHRLRDAGGLIARLRDPAHATLIPVLVDLRPIPATLALSALATVYLLPLGARLRARLS